MNIVVDTNILISALIKEGITRDLIINSNFNLFFPEFEFTEIEKHKNEILEKSGLSEKDFDTLFSKLLNYFKVVKTKEAINHKKRAREIIGHIDGDDVIFIATALVHNAAIWSDDLHFQKQNTINILTTSEMVKLQK
ncbi:MAG: PIN domain-containing protein [Nanoarchaeota archaeon]|nr:PIN domain-containing protein [Nanoarchaeota archaeon]